MGKKRPPKWVVEPEDPDFPAGTWRFSLISTANGKFICGGWGYNDKRGALRGLALVQNGKEYEVEVIEKHGTG